MDEINNRDRIFGLDLMRAVAILMVLLGHCAWIIPGGQGIVPSLLALSSFMGVEIFFVLSGFLIGRILYRQFTEGNFTFQSVLYFLNRRWFRTLPNYFLVLLINSIIAFWLDTMPENLWKYFFFLQNLASPMPLFFTESWSLSIEEYAYILLPFVLLAFVFFFRTANRSRLFLRVTLMLVFLCLLMKILYNASSGNTTIGQWNGALKPVVIYRLDAIFIGVLCAWIYANYFGFWQRTKIFWLCLGCGMMAFFTFGVGFLGLFIDRYPFFWNVLYLPLVSVSVAFFLPVLSQWKSNSLLRKPITFISLVSYSIYLLHYSIILQTMKYFTDTENLSSGGVLLFTACYLSVTICCSWILYVFYEKPMTNLRKGTT